jgi:NAD(P)H-dependent flavin oxidoreductase YrpB (nitropropane dioxygenase family)
LSLFAARYPIVQAPMAYVQPPSVAAATSNAGALGTIAGAPLGPQELRAAIREVRAATEAPFGVNLFAPPFLGEGQLEVVLEEQPAVFSFTFGLVDPEPLREAVVTPAYTGRHMRAARTPLLGELMAGPPPLPFPQQRAVSAERGPVFMGGTGARRAREQSVAELVSSLADGAR